MPKNSLQKKFSILRLLIAFGVLVFFIYAYISGSLNSNAVMAMLIKSQFSAVLYGSGIVVIFILVLTLIFGRFFCSVMCPLGTLQELIWRCGNFFKSKRSRNSQKSVFFRTGYTDAPKLRYVVPLLVGTGVIFSFFPLMMIVDPISTFGRGIGAVRAVLEKNASLLAFGLALPMVVVLVAAFFRGRAFCGWCPVGITLGMFSSIAKFGMRISSKCVSCGKCEKKCPAGCINSQEKRIENERCVLCFSCAAECPAGGVSYTKKTKEAADESRRVFLKSAGSKAGRIFCALYLLSPSLRLFSANALGDAAGETAGNAVNANLPILPPGAGNFKHYISRCIGCQACVSSCPVNIIKIKNSPHPVLDYAHAGCQYNCLECGNVCPTGAIRPLEVEEKQKTRVALSALYFERCVVNTKKEFCGACAEVCPTSAITMTAYTESGVARLTKPVFYEEYCIGCGACLAACPAEPRAFILTAVGQQSLVTGARPAEESDDELKIADDLPF